MSRPFVHILCVHTDIVKLEKTQLKKSSKAWLGSEEANVDMSKNKTLAAKGHTLAQGRVANLVGDGKQVAASRDPKK